MSHCATTPGWFIHQPDPRKTLDVPPEEREAFWEKLYGEPGFGIWMRNFRDILTDEKANAAIGAYIAKKIRQRVKDPKVADKLIPKDHGSAQGTPTTPVAPSTRVAKTNDINIFPDNSVIKEEAPWINLLERIHQIYATPTSYRTDVQSALQVASNRLTMSICSECRANLVIYCRDPIKSIQNLRGAKIRLSLTSSDFTERIIAQLHATAIEVSTSQTVSALKSGVLDMSHFLNTRH